MVDPKDTSAGSEARPTGGNPVPSTIISNPPSFDARATDVEVATGVKRENMRGVQKEIVKGSGESDTKTEACPGMKPWGIGGSWQMVVVCVTATAGVWSPVRPSGSTPAGDANRTCHGVL
jgi:hypothetical protein